MHGGARLHLVCTRSSIASRQSAVVWRSSQGYRSLVRVKVRVRVRGRVRGRVKVKVKVRVRVRAFLVPRRAVCDEQETQVAYMVEAVEPALEALEDHQVQRR